MGKWFPRLDMFAPLFFKVFPKYQNQNIVKMFMLKSYLHDNIGSGQHSWDKCRREPEPLQ